jgi:hypothetical protein
MKNFDIWAHLRLGGLIDERLGIHLHTGAYMLYALGHDAVAGFHSFLNDPQGAEAFADFHRLNDHFVLAVEEGNLIAALKFCNRALGN